MDDHFECYVRPLEVTLPDGAVRKLFEAYRIERTVEFSHHISLGFAYSEPEAVLFANSNDLLRYGHSLVRRLEMISTDEFAAGKERSEREALKSVLERIPKTDMSLGPPAMHERWTDCGWIDLEQEIEQE